MKKIDLMIFDLDGTLADSAADLIAAVNHTRGLLGLVPMDNREVLGYVGDGAAKLVERFVGQELWHRRDEAMEIFIRYYEAHLLDNTVLYPGVFDALNFFRNKKKVIITNKRSHFARKITDGLNISSYFEDIVGIGSTPYCKPDSRIVLPVLKRYNADHDDTVIFGDGVNDIKLAENAGIRSCAMLNGFTPRDVLLSLKPDFACEDMGKLRDIFC